MIIKKMKSSSLESIGIKATKIYIILLAAILPPLALVGGIELKSIELNELGDFLAGIFGPLAIFWLVLGFFQQRKELKNSAEALRLQARELSAAADAQKEANEIAGRQIQESQNLARATRALSKTAETLLGSGPIDFRVGA
ncbi:hypothetical protein [Tropicimonas isoalkanivorans]|uniref:hypothetical protein n=1 Tax=Tropicimonas isoalkanivorans TaxID=441112 RepID=UPI000B873A89|nr:hypothetical protein [Tropicimonas isoalkanivorans]